MQHHEGFADAHIGCNSPSRLQATLISLHSLLLQLSMKAHSVQHVSVYLINLTVPGFVPIQLVNRTTSAASLLPHNVT